MKFPSHRSPIVGISIAAGVSLVAFYPLIHWIAVYTGQNKQLLHSFMILAFAGAMLTYENNERMRLIVEFNRRAVVGFVGAYLLIGISYFTHHSIFYLPALVAAIYGWLHFLFGSRYSRILTGLLAAFSIFLIMLIAFPSVDWPLRILAGRSALWIFENLGNESHLFLTNLGESAEGPMLIITLGDRPFHVAPECNGFGVLSASLLLSILISVYQRPGWVRSVGFWASSLGVGLFINTLRIFIIMSLASSVGDHYMLMHEIVGVSLFWAGIISVWMLGMRVFSRKKTPQDSALETEITT